MKKTFLLFTAFCTLLFTSCGDFQDVTFLGIENVKVNKLSQQGIDIDVTAKIKNPNNIAFTIYRSDLDATFSNMNVGKAAITKNVKIKANSEQSYTFNVKSDFSKLSAGELPNLLSIALSKSIKVGLKGNLKVGKLLMKKDYPVDMVKSVPLNFGGL
ncbi:MAG: LEA type 2 family protein [Bacteroidetes bacterium]|nr:LEA type 2 family protein [Bacteroidota bacterium]